MERNLIIAIVEELSADRMALPEKIRFHCRFNRASWRAYKVSMDPARLGGWGGMEKLVESESLKSTPIARELGETKERGRKRANPEGG